MSSPTLVVGDDGDDSDDDDHHRCHDDVDLNISVVPNGEKHEITVGGVESTATEPRDLVRSKYKISIVLEQLFVVVHKCQIRPSRLFY